MNYAGASRLTDPGSAAELLDVLADDVDGICRLAATQTIHHNLRAALGLPRSQWGELVRVWPPQLGDMLRALGSLEPERPLERRVVGACVLESYFLAGLLRFRGFEVRVRAGYFCGIREHAEHIKPTAKRARPPDRALAVRDPRGRHLAAA